MVVGPYTSACAAAVAKQTEQYQMAQVIPAASKEDLSRLGYKWVFRVNAPGSVYAKSLIDAALSFGKPKTVAFIYESTDFGSSLSKVGKEYAISKGLKVVADEGYQAGSPDYRSTLSKVKGANPDLVFLVSYVADAILLMRQSRELGPEAPGLPGRRRRLRHRPVREGGGDLHQRLLGHPVDPRLQPGRRGLQQALHRQVRQAPHLPRRLHLHRHDRGRRGGRQGRRRPRQDPGEPRHHDLERHHGRR